MEYVINPPATASIEVAESSARFPVRRIFCVGRNYAAHAKEMGKDPDRDPPFFFTKPADAVVDSKTKIPYPPDTSNVHYEIELVVAIAKPGFRIEIEDAASHIYGYGVGIDLTRRDLQLQARDQGRPWDWGKAFDRSALCAPLHAIDETEELTRGRIWLKVGDDMKQESDISKLIWSVNEIIAALSRSIRLAPGDLIYTGTPEGVGPVQAGETMYGGIDGLTDIEIELTQAE